jgi:hypothetical protein
MIGRKGLEGGWRTPLHAATEWPGYFPAAPAAVVLLLEAGANPNDDTGGDRPGRQTSSAGCRREAPHRQIARTDPMSTAGCLRRAEALRSRQLRRVAVVEDQGVAVEVLEDRLEADT